MWTSRSAKRPKHAGSMAMSSLSRSAERARSKVICGSTQEAASTQHSPASTRNSVISLPWSDIMNARRDPERRKITPVQPYPHPWTMSPAVKRRTRAWRASSSRSAGPMSVQNGSRSASWSSVGMRVSGAVTGGSFARRAGARAGGAAWMPRPCGRRVCPYGTRPRRAFGHVLRTLPGSPAAGMWLRAPYAAGVRPRPGRGRYTAIPQPPTPTVATRRSSSVCSRNPKPPATFAQSYPCWVRIRQAR